MDPTWMDDLDCAGTESGLASCPFRGWGVENGSHYEDIGLSCMPQAPCRADGRDVGRGSSKFLWRA